jgi:glycosyltransferase involved in cell wall biosynthesis
VSDLPRVLHAPIDVANQAALSALGLRELGAAARCLAPPHPLDYETAPDIVPPGGRIASLRMAARALRDHDVLHFHYGQSLLREPLGALDARLARRLGRRVVVEFHGSDVRMPSVERTRNPHYVWLEGEDDAVAAARLRRWSAITQGHVVQCDHSLDHVLAPWFPHVHVVGHRVDTRRFEPAFPAARTDVPVVVHSPSTIAAKGTPIVRAAIATLREQGVPLEYVEVHDVTHAEATARYRRADLVIDQMCTGSHGVFAVEAMSLGKPVVCYLLPDLVERFPADLPLIPATPDTLAEVLAEWLAPSAPRAARGRAGRAYAEREHDVRVVARRLLDVYESLPR